MALESAAQIMEKLGFNRDAEDSAKTAFLRHLIKTTYQVEVRPPLRLEKASAAHRDAAHPVQLSFDFAPHLQTG